MVASRHRAPLVLWGGCACVVGGAWLGIWPFTFVFALSPLTLVAPPAIAAVGFVLVAVGAVRAPNATRRSRTTDTRHSVLTPLIILAVLYPITAFVAAHQDVFPTTGLVTGVSVFWQYAIAIVLLDFIAYWTHRVSHRWAPLWRFHRVHHSLYGFHWLAYARSNPVEGIFGGLVNLAPLILLGIDPWVGLAYSSTQLLVAVVVHADLPTPETRVAALLVTPRFHRWHHATEFEAYDKNFGAIFTIWDRLFSTTYLPAGRTPDGYGIDDGPPEGWLAHLVEPIRPSLAAQLAASPRGDAEAYSDV